MTLQVLDGPTIPAGQSMSDALDVSAGRLLRLTTPLGWDTAEVTFQISTDGQFFNDLFTADGKEVLIVCNGMNRAIIVPAQFTEAFNFIKFRSGTTMRPIVQSADRVFAVTLDVPVTP